MISRLEDALAHNQRFSADVSHELRTPLTILRGEFEHMVQLPLLPPAVLDTIGSAIEEIDRLSKIVDSLLDISKIDSGGAHIKRAPVDLSLIAASTVEQMRLLAEEKHISVFCTQRGPVVVLGDDVRLKQVLVNLLDNAIKYTGEGGRVDIDVTASDGQAIVQVSDDGIGVPSASLLHVFERFYRADRARSRESGGSGLGLSIVKAICTAHHGAVSISSVEGEGTQVRVTLPLLAPAALHSLSTANFAHPAEDLQPTN
jgi:signal transduction histidine kinase